MKKKLIHDKDFCLINTDKFEEHDIKIGQRVYIAGHKALPISEEDPYTQRIKFLVHLVIDGHVRFGPLYLMDPNSLVRVGKREQNNLEATLNKDVEDAATD